MWRGTMQAARVDEFTSTEPGRRGYVIESAPGHPGLVALAVNLLVPGYTFTGLMGILNCLAFACMYRFLARETADELLAFLGLATILFFSYSPAG